MISSGSVSELKKEAVGEPIVAEAQPEPGKTAQTPSAEPQPAGKNAIPGKSLEEMLEKNLKWSQIIYEQNRRISRRLLWSLIAGWVKWILVAVIIVLSIWYAWPIYRTFQAQYSAIVNQMDPTKPLDKAGLEKVLQMLPLNSASQEQIKALLK